jgi:hypothetical protein
VLDFIDDTPALTPTEAQILRGFQMQLGGSAGDFFYTDPTDHAVGPRTDQWKLQTRTLNSRSSTTAPVTTSRQFNET